MKAILLSVTAIWLTISPLPAQSNTPIGPLVPFGVIKGSVRNIQTNQFVPWASVELVGVMPPTLLPDGTFEFYMVPPGVYTVKAMMTGYLVAYIDNVVVRMGQVTYVEAKIQPTDAQVAPSDLVSVAGVFQPEAITPVGIIRGRILDADTKRPLAYGNAMVAGTTYGAMTKEDGTFEILRVPPGVHEVKVMMMGYERTSIDSVAVRPYDKTDLPPLLVISMGPRWPDSEAAERSIVGTETRATVADIRCEIVPVGGSTFHVGDMPTFKVVMRNVGRESFYLVRELDKSFHGYRYPKMSITIEGPGRGPTRLGIVCGNTNNPEPGDFALVHPDRTFQPFDVYVSYDEFAQPGQYEVTFTYDTNAIDYRYWVDQLNYHGMNPRAYMLLKQVPRIQLSQTIMVDVVE